jgi:hypothetical protein
VAETTALLGHHRAEQVKQRRQLGLRTADGDIILLHYLLLNVTPPRMQLGPRFRSLMEYACLQVHEQVRTTWCSSKSQTGSSCGGQSGNEFCTYWKADMTSVQRVVRRDTDGHRRGANRAPIATHGQAR